MYGADTPADWSDVKVEKDKEIVVDPSIQAEYDRISLIMKAMPYSPDAIVDVGMTSVFGAENVKGGDVFVPKKTDLKDILEVSAHYGKWGSAISDMNGRLFATAGQILKAWGVDGWKSVQESDKLSTEFLMDLRDWFIVKYMPMLNACATIAMYAEFKGVSYSAMTSRVNYQETKLTRDGDDMSVEYFGGVGGLRKTRPRRDPMQFVFISGVRHILVPVDEIKEWYMFLARKGMGVLVSEAKFGEARYLGNMLVEAGEMNSEEMEEALLAKDTVELWLKDEKMVQVGEDRAIGDPRRWGGDGRQQSFTDEAWDRYSLWCKSRGIMPLAFVPFVKRVYGLGYDRFSKKGKRGFYWYYTPNDATTKTHF